MVDAIRFYELRGLLPRAQRSEGGFRLYTEAEVGALRFLRQMQSLGCSLHEIRELLSLRGDGAHACEHVRDLLTVNLAAVHAKLGELRKLERDLRHLLGPMPPHVNEERPARTPLSCTGGRKGGPEATRIVHHEADLFERANVLE